MWPSGYAAGQLLPSLEINGESSNNSMGGSSQEMHLAHWFHNRLTRAMILYSASTDERNTIFCFSAFQAIGDSISETQ